MVAQAIRGRLLLLASAIVAAGLAMLATLAGAAATETRDSACAACHLPPETRFVARSMAVAPADLASTHAITDEGEGLRCIDCHADEGLAGRLRALRLGAIDGYSHLRGDYVVVGQEYLPFGSLAHPTSLRGCRDCHEESVSRPGHENHFHNLLDDPEAPEQGCDACHRAHRLALEPPYFVDDASVAGGCAECHAAMGGPSNPFGLEGPRLDSPALALLRSPPR